MHSPTIKRIICGLCLLQGAMETEISHNFPRAGFRGGSCGSVESPPPPLLNIHTPLNSLPYTFLQIPFTTYEWVANSILRRLIRVYTVCLGLSFRIRKGWSGEAKMPCIFCHRGVQLTLAYSWATPAILVAGTGGGGVFLFLLLLHFHSFSFTPVPLSPPLLSLFSLSLGDDTKWSSLRVWRVVKPQLNQSNFPNT